MNGIQIKRIYEKPDSEDGYRILIDRLWPRGIKKEDVEINEWNKEIAPSTELRKWFNHQQEKFEEFSELYKQELSNKGEQLSHIRSIAKTENITLLYAAKDRKINHAVILQKILSTENLE